MVTGKSPFYGHSQQQQSEDSAHAFIALGCLCVEDVQDFFQDYCWM